MDYMVNGNKVVTHRISLSWVVPHVDVGMIQGFLDRDARLWINYQHL